MSACIQARMVTIRLREKPKPHDVHVAKVLCPVRWSKSKLLAYCRREHEEETVRILDWGTYYSPWDDRALWMVAPEEMV